MLLAGCASEDYHANLKANDAIHQEITQLSTVPEISKVSHITKPPIAIVPIEEKLEQRYLDEPSPLMSLICRFLWF
ncbi:hypothetical protein JCM19239_6079 [Vibrio variabilis]|uniref:Lipoprotein n=1 Tax=Vibrio variabilis TaxID=990271 RepID=A0ABQ0JJT1_9VIBR|nr:hypothetical protein JCM19239_6079 [Vibrio variabilis]